MKSFALLSVVVGMFVIPAVASAGQATFLNGTIVANIPAKDLPAFKAKVGDVLNNTADNTPSTWTSSQTSVNRQVSVEFKPLATVETKSAQTCRLLAAQVTRQKASEHWQFWFCKQTDGTWKASSAPE